MSQVRPIDHFLVLGAGASMGARAILAEQAPPLGNELGDYLWRWWQANDPGSLDPTDEPNAYLRSLTDHNDPTSPSIHLWSDKSTRIFLERLKTCDASRCPTRFESAVAETLDAFSTNNAEFNELWRHGRKDEAYARMRKHPDLRSINRLLAWSMIVGEGCRFPEQQDLLDQLLTLLRGEHLAIITLNYDLLTEEAVGRVRSASNWQTEVEYVGPRCHHPPLNPNPILIFKLHGSINWLQHRSPAASADLSVALEQNALRPPLTLGGELSAPDTQEEYIPPDRANIVLEMKRDATLAPVMALYGPDKPRPLNSGCIERARQRCLETIRNNPHASVTVIGMRIPDRADDQPLLRVLDALRSCKGKRIYVSPSDTDCNLAAEFGFAPARHTFQQHLEQFAERA